MSNKLHEDKHRENMFLMMQDSQDEVPSQPPLPSLSPPPPPAGGGGGVGSPPPPSSASSSPSHEFSFTISLHPTSTKSSPKTNKSPPPSFALDLSPADEIFFHGHLLPLHLLSHLPVSPRSSTNSMDSFTLPTKNYLQNPQNPTYNNQTHHNNDRKTHTKPKPNNKSPFSLFTLPTKQRKSSHEEEVGNKEKQWRKLKFEVTQAVKRYMRMVRPLLSFKNKRADMEFHRQAHSYSGTSNMVRRNRGDFRGAYSSAPVSTTTSPTNSGLLVSPSTFSSQSDSTMEELQAAIQAAIAHCKKSVAIEEKIKCHDTDVQSPGVRGSHMDLSSNI